MTLEFQNQISIQPQEESGGGGGDTPTGRDVGTMYQSVSADGTTFGTYSEMTSNTVAELARLRPFSSSDTGLLNYWDYTGVLSLTVKFTYETGVGSTWYNNPFVIIYANGDGNYYDSVAHVENNQLRIAYQGAPTKQLTAGHTYTIKLSLDANTNETLLYCKEEGVDSDFVLIDTHTASSTESVTRAYIQIDNNLLEGYRKPYHKFADFDLSDITIDIDGEVIFSRAKGGSEGGGGGGTPSVGIPREVTAQGVLQMPLSVTSYKLPEGVTDIGDYAMYYAFAYASGITSVDLSKLTTISGQDALSSAFYHAGVQNVDVSNLVSITGEYGMSYAFYTNSNLQTIEFPKLVSIGERAFASTFNGCSGLTNISFPELTTISGEYGMNNTFANCAKLTTVTFPKLTTLSKNAMYGCFENCTGITDVYFPALTTSSFPSGVGYGNTPLRIFSNSVRGKIHLPSNLSSITWIQNGMGGSREQYFGSDYCTVLLDLPATS